MGAGNRRALLVENSRTAAVIATAVLRACGYGFFCASSACGARAAWQPLAFALFVIDIGIPAQESSGEPGDGLDVATWFRSHGEKAPIIIWTAKDTANVRRRATSAQTQFVPKDAGGEGLRRTIMALGGL